MRVLVVALTIGLFVIALPMAPGTKADGCLDSVVQADNPGCAGEMAISRGDTEANLLLAKVDGVECDFKNFNIRSEIKGTNFSAWILVEEPDLVESILETVAGGTRDIRVGWHWDTGMTKDALTFKWTLNNIPDGPGSPEYFVEEATITDTCGVHLANVQVGGLEGKSAHLEALWTFSGAQITVTDTQGIIREVGLHASATYEWSVGISLTNVETEFGGSFTYGGSLVFQYSAETSVAVTSITKTAIGNVWIGPGPVPTEVFPDAIAVDQLAVALCYEKLIRELIGGSAGAQANELCPLIVVSDPDDSVSV